LLLIGCFSPNVIVDSQNRSYTAKEIGVFITLPPDWRLSESEKFLFTAHFEPNGTSLARLTAVAEKNIPSLEDYFRLEPLFTLAQKTQKITQGELTRLQHLSSRKFELKGTSWYEMIWLAERKGEAKVFHTYTLSAGLNLLQLYFEFPVSMHDGLKQIISPVLEALQVDPPPVSDLQVARAYQAVGDIYKSRNMWKEAIDAYNVALGKQPRSEALHLILGQSYLQNEETDLAERAFLKALELDSQNAQAYAGLADVYLKKGSNPQGINAARQAVGLEPDNSAFYIKLADAYLKENRPQEAIKTYQKLLRRKPESAEGHFGLGKAYLATELYEQAILELEQALKLNAQQAEAHCLLEKAYTQLQSSADAEREKKLCPPSTSAGPVAPS
jgi:tetratricopeptide (TPR) repeat protein